MLIVTLHPLLRNRAVLCEARRHSCTLANLAFGPVVGGFCLARSREVQMGPAESIKKYHGVPWSVAAERITEINPRSKLHRRAATTI